MPSGNNLFSDVDPIRRKIMAAIRSRNTKPEKIVRSVLHALGYRFRIHVARLPGRPDLVFPGRKVAIFVHGCFWHQHAGCRHAKIPRTRTDYWQEKFRQNAERDLANQRKLRRLGWRVLVVWECQAPASWLRRAIPALEGPKDSKSTRK